MSLADAYELEARAEELADAVRELERLAEGWGEGQAWVGQARMALLCAKDEFRHAAAAELEEAAA